MEYLLELKSIIVLCLAWKALSISNKQKEKQ